jgi:ubiquinone/menaquinone biosynthesis C-methylase UbiE
MIDRAELIRERMRRKFGAMTREYATIGAQSHAEHSELLVARVGPAPGAHVLDVATGPGGVALAAAAAVGPRGRVLATDLAPEWQEVVEAACSEAGVTNVAFRAMGAEALELPDTSFDVVFCKLGLMFVPDPVRALGEMRRVLRPGGRLGIMVWSTADKVAHHGIAARALAAHGPQLGFEIRLPGPLELGEPGLIERCVAAAGFKEILVERHTLECVYSSPEEYCRRHLESTSSGGRSPLDALTDVQRERVYQHVLGQLEHYRREDRICLPSEAIYVTASR